MSKRRNWFFFVFACVSGIAAPARAELSVGPFLPAHTWPISRTDVPARHISATFGPRLRLATIYDYHRGIDIPAPYGTPIHAVADGVVRIAGSWPSYINPLVQIKHYRPKSQGSCANNGCYYTNYLHISAAAVSIGQVVKRGDVIGYTGESDAGYAHLHFEVRDGGLNSMHCIHPLAILKHAGTPAPAVTLTSVDASSLPGSVVVAGDVVVSPEELDLNRVEVDVYDTSSGSMVLSDSGAFDFNEWNRLYSPGDAPDLYLTDPTFHGVTVTPAVFKGGTPEYKISFSFMDLAGPSNPENRVVRMRATDLSGHTGADYFY